MNKKIVLFNGPLNCGKSFVIKELFPDWEKAECKEKLHKLTMELFCVPEDEYWEIYNTRELKEAPNSYFTVKSSEVITYYWFRGFPVDVYTKIFDRQEALGTTLEEEWQLTIREAMIYVSEAICKPLLWSDYFGRARANKILQSNQNLFVDDSCGFAEELPPLVEALGQENILLLRIHRPGCSFEGDSRDYIPDGVLDNTIDIYNNTTERDYLNTVKEVVNQWLQTS